jgi:acetylornithine deacetylase/succinyl-diaminopimelate desuccinylase-like protein
MRRVIAALLLLVATVACSASPPGASSAGSTPADGTTSPQPSASPAAASPSRTVVATPTPRATLRPAMNAQAALRDIVHLASDIGPREATSDNYTEAARFVEARFERLGYDVRRTKVAVPSGISWGTPVRRGTSLNVIAEPEGFDAKQPHVMIGAHLDTVPVAPGAEDNASGVAVMLQLAAMVSQQPAALPVQFIAFGAEEPRGSGDALHHFGSRQHVADLSRPERRAIQAMVSLDRVGVRASYVPICTATDRGTRLRDAIRAAARRAEITTRACTNYTSDHWSYAKAGVPAVRLGSVPYAGYHSRGDVPRVVDRRQLDRVGRTVWAWLQSLN